MNNTFNGFPTDLIAFLEQLSKNNNREWFAENKQRYRDSIQIPMSNFIMALAPGLDRTANCFIADPRLNGSSMFRIYKDARYSRNKPPFKTNVGCQFRHEAGKNAHAPGFYLHIEPGNSFIGGGIYRPDANALLQIRTAIAENPEKWHQVIHDKEMKKHYGEVSGESLKRPPRGFSAEHQHIEHLKKKTFFVIKPLETKQLYSEHFVQQAEDLFQSASPLMRFLTEAVELPYSI
ncbi:MAG: DUF2461 domain-containing protein [Gammaproteobacteria bacterium]|nr:DUF2461 domain-containing protein [Gammaproteobacteria bacterium]